MGRLIEKIQVEFVERDGETKSVFRVTLVNKAVALGLAMKHIGIEKHEVTQKLTVDWDALCGASQNEPDPIEARIAEVSRFDATSG